MTRRAKAGGEGVAVAGPGLLRRGGVRGAVVGLALALGFALVGLTAAPAMAAPAVVAPASLAAPAVGSPAVAALAAAAAPAKAAPSAAEPAPISAIGTGVNDFTFTSFSGDYTLGRDASGHSTLTTVETLDAQFPSIDQNHGIQRAIPTKYDGHPTDVNIVSITDGNGNARSYSTQTQDDLLLVTIAADDYVHGSQAYVLTYTQTNVTQYFSNTNDDEFYWDTNGTAWKQPFASATATVHVPADLAGNLNGKTACYWGVAGATDTCDITSSATASATTGAADTTFTTSPQQLAAGENVTVSIGFQPGTFTPRDNSFFASPAAIAELIFAILAVLVAVGAIILRSTYLKDGKGRPTIIAEYTVPPGVNLLVASVIYKQDKRAPAASFVSLAVRRNIQIVEQEKSGWGGKTYWLRLTSLDGLDPTELELVKLLFGDSLQLGAWMQIQKQDTTLAKGIYALMQSTRKQVVTDGLVRGGTTLFSALFALAVIVFGGLAFLAGSLAIGDDYGGALPFILIGVCVVAAITVFVAGFKKPLTATGAELRDYIKGLELYIRLAEKDRFAMLQSPEGALKTQVNAPDWGQVVKIYEKLLPYAVLLNLETEWSQVLGTYYEQLGSQPEWYGGNVGAFNAALFVGTISSLSSVVDSSLAASTSSSSSGGSGGGGFSGGGGGGGGGGGV
ncbi:DUF2207 domain-containing protein [Subtercola lobariae]|uniref:DUF2207 domain-containing protein n=1 Tax=Subtercola lobariae TaxID=1588641 RepID=A0A917B7Y2_9MICO|nr:DUF2207 domain-containing protein [Subtercola lobariae]GGF30204.1 hypothetical protein GCM10011399_24250 [Subtercola lobariae]